MGKPSATKVNMVLEALRDSVDKTNVEVDAEGREVARINFPPGIRSLERFIPEKCGLPVYVCVQSVRILADAGWVEHGKRGAGGYRRKVVLKGKFSYPDTSN